TAYLDQTDARMAGKGLGLVFTRSYNSATALPFSPWVYGIFGPGWNHSYEKRLHFATPVPPTPAGDLILLRESDGTPAYYAYAQATGRFEPSLPLSVENWIERIVQQGTTTYVRKFRKGGKETYNSDGRLMSLEDPASPTNVTTLAYDATYPDRLVTITDPGGRQLTLEYDPGSSQPDRLVGPAGVIARYTYEGNTLKTVSYEDSDDDDSL